MTLIATDLDGTIVDAAKHVSDRTTRALEQCARRGDTVVFLTGRSHRDSMEGLPLDVLTDGRMFCANGAIEFDVWSGHVVQAETINERALRHAIDVCTGRFPGGHWCIDGLDHTVFQSGHPWAPPEPSPTAVMRDDVRSVLDGTFGPFKVTYLHDDVRPSTMAEALEDELDGIVGLTYGSTRNPYFLEMTPPGVSKGSALERFAVAHGAPSNEIIAFGDMPNDITMFQVAGVSYAMGDADPAVVAAATAQTPDVEHDGVALVLEDYLQRVQAPQRS